MGKSHYIIPVFVPDLGCPHRCVFCNQTRITGIDRVPTSKEVESQIAEYLKTIPKDLNITREVAFYGGSFTAVNQKLQRELLSPAYRCLADGSIDRIRVSTRPDAISEEILALLSGFGVDTVELGVQSMDDEVLHRSGRGHTSRDVIRAADLIKSWGMTLGVQMIVGLPGDTEAKDVNSALELIGLKPAMVRIYPCLVLKGTKLAEMYEKGEYTPLSIDEAVERSRKLLLLFAKAEINVIRIGLQPSEQINLEGEVIAGPYHSAFRELVETALSRTQLEYLLVNEARIKRAGLLELAVAQKDVSIVRGHQGSNIQYFGNKFEIKKFITKEDKSLPRGSIRLLQVDDNKYNLVMKRTELPVS